MSFSAQRMKRGEGSTDAGFCRTFALGAQSDKAMNCDYLDGPHSFGGIVGCAFVSVDVQASAISGQVAGCFNRGR